MTKTRKFWRAATVLLMMMLTMCAQTAWADGGIRKLTLGEGITASGEGLVLQSDGSYHVPVGTVVTLGNTKSGYSCGGYELSAGTLDNSNVNSSKFTMPDQDVIVRADFTPNSKITTVNNWVELQSAINDGAVIELSGDDVYYAEGSCISIDAGTVTIYGNGHTIDAQRLNARIFEVNNGATLILKKLVLKNVTQTGDGGAIYNDGGTLNVANCTFTNNTATTENGGAIYNKEGTLRIVSSRFERNSKYDRAIYNYAEEDNPFSLTIINCTMIEDKVCVNYEDKERRLDDKRDIDLLTTEYNAVIPEVNGDGTPVSINLNGIDTFFFGDVTVKLSNPSSETETVIKVPVANGEGSNSVSLDINQYTAKFTNFISLTEEAFERDDIKPYQQMTFRVVADYATANAGTQTDPYVIYSKDQLDLLAMRVNAGESYSGKFFKVGADITYTHTTDWDDASSTENNYTAIGIQTDWTEQNAFSGTFDGDGHTISGIRIYKNGSELTDINLGIFGYVVDGTVKNVTLADARITGTGSVGGIVGATMANEKDCLVENCHVLGNVALQTKGTYPWNFGGIVGNNMVNNNSNKEATISGCTSSVSITIGENVDKSTCSGYGGIVGCNDKGTLRNNLAIGCTIPDEVFCTGAIIGYDLKSNGFIENNYYSDCTIGTATSDIGCGGTDYINTDLTDITDNDGAVPATILSDAEPTLPALTAGEKVAFRREFTGGKASTIVFPFDYTPSAAEGTFYTFSGVGNDGDKWIVTMNEYTDATLEANTPYLFMPAGSDGIVPVLFHGEVVDEISAGTTVQGDWTFTGTYDRKQWDSTHNTDEIGSVYGFAAQAGTSTDGQNTAIEAGNFFRVAGGPNSYIVPFRAYLKYTGTAHGNAPAYSTTRSASAIGELPAQMIVRLVGSNGETTSLSEELRVKSEDAVWYDLSGRKLDGKPSQRGIYLNNGKKVVVH